MGRPEGGARRQRQHIAGARRTHAAHAREPRGCLAGGGGKAGACATSTAVEHSLRGSPVVRQVQAAPVGASEGWALAVPGGALAMRTAWVVSSHCVASRLVQCCTSAPMWGATHLWKHRLALAPSSWRYAQTRPALQLWCGSPPAPPHPTALRARPFASRRSTRPLQTPHGRAKGKRDLACGAEVGHSLGRLAGIGALWRIPWFMWVSQHGGDGLG